MSNEEKQDLIIITVYGKFFILKIKKKKSMKNLKKFICKKINY